jgi:periplasmic protein TonB
MKNKFMALSLLAVSLTVSRSFADTIHVSEQDAEKAIVQRVQPVYPPIAKLSNLFGQVVVDMTVGENGAVEQADVVSGNPILGGAAKTAAKNWKFQPFLSDGKPSKAVVRISFNFKR